MKKDVKGFTIDCNYLIKVADYMPILLPRPRLKIISIEIGVWE